jgi:hypothetical protein
MTFPILNDANVDDDFNANVDADMRDDANGGANF